MLKSTNDFVLYFNRLFCAGSLKDCIFNIFECSNLCLLRMFTCRELIEILVKSKAFYDDRVLQVDNMPTKFLSKF